MVLTACLNGLCPVNLFQNHNPSQMMGESHRPHGEPEVSPVFHPLRHAEGGTDEKTGAGFSAELYFLQLLREVFAGQGLTLRGQNTEPGTFGDFGENQLCFLLQTR